MEKARKITNGICWGITIITGLLLLVSWKEIPALVITHIGAGVSYGSKNTLLVIFGIEIVVNVLFMLHYDIPFIREMRKTKMSSGLLNVMAIVIQIAAVIILSLFVLLAVMQ